MRKIGAPKGAQALLPAALSFHSFQLGRHECPPSFQFRTSRIPPPQPAVSAPDYAGSAPALPEEKRNPTRHSPAPGLVTHPVPRSTDSIPYLCVVFCCTRERGHRSRTCFHRHVRIPTAAFATPGRPWVGFPGFNRYYAVAKTASVRLCTFALSLGARYLGSPAVFASGRPRGRRTWVWTLIHRSGPCRLFPRRQEVLPASRETLYCSAPLPSDPGRTSAPDLNGASVLPAFFLQRRLHRYNPFRGSITRLRSSLPTLEGAVSGRQPRLASGCRSGFAGRVGSRRVSVETFVRSFAVVVLSLLVRAPSRLIGLLLAPRKLDFHGEGFKGRVVG